MVSAVTHILLPGSANWMRLSGVLSDRIISLVVKGKGYKTVVRPVMLYGADTLAVKKVHMKKGWQMILRWMCGVTKQNRKLIK